MKQSKQKHFLIKLIKTNISFQLECLSLAFQIITFQVNSNDLLTFVITT